MTSSLRFALPFVLASLAGCATAPTAQAPLRPSLAAAPLEAEPQVDLDLSADRSASGFFMAGAAALHEGRAQDAAQFFDRASQLAPEEDRSFLREQAFNAAVMAGDIERAARMAPTDVDSASYRLGRLVVAIDDLARRDGAGAYAILKNEDFGPGFRRAADLVRPWAALAAGDAAAATAGAPSLTDPQEVFNALNHALVLEAAGKTDEAGTLYAALSGKGTGIGAFTLAHGAYLERRGMRREAVAIYDAFLKSDPQDSAVLAARARAASRRSAAPTAPTAQEGAGQALLIGAMISLVQRDATSVVVYLQLSLRLDPDRSDAMLMAGDVLSETGDPAGARAVYARVPASAPEFMAAQARIVSSYQKADDDEAALQAARRLADAAPRELGAQILLADVLRDTKDYAGSARVLDQVIAARSSAAEWNLYYARAISRQLAGDWPGAEKDLLQAYALAPEEPDVLNYLGYSWADRGERLDEALGLLKKAAAGDPNSGAVIDSLGWAYYKTGDYAKAVENLERAVELTPAAADINDHLGDVYAKVGRTLEARYQWERVLTLEAEPEMKAKVRAKLDATPAPAPVVAASLAPETAAR